MKTTHKMPVTVESISALHRLLNLPKPAHPLISVVQCDQFSPQALDALTPVISVFYIVSIIQDFNGKVKYGQHHYDFDGGVMSFLAPGQLIASTTTQPYPGISLIVHPDLLRILSYCRLLILETN